MADHSASLEQVRSDLRRLSGSIEEIDFQSRGKAAEIRKALDFVSSRVPPPACVPDELLSNDDDAVSANSSQSASVFKGGLQKIRSGDFQSSISSFENFLDSDPATVMSDNALFWIGVAQKCLNQIDKSVLTFNEIFTKFPGEDRASWSLYYLANLFEKMGQKQEAKITYQKVIDDFPSTPPARKAGEKLRIDYPEPKKSSTKKPVSSKNK